MSKDPLGFADGGNPYRFAGNDPINYADPTGTTQAGYPLSSPSMAGGYSGGRGTESIPIRSAPFHHPGRKRRLAAERARAVTVS